MTVLKATRKVLRLLRSPAGPAQSADTALGDWYVNRIVIDRQPLLLLLSARSLLPILTPARNVRELPPPRLPELVGARLRRLGIPFSIIDAELAEMHPVTVAPTVDRVVLGYLVDFAKAAPFYLEINGWDLTTLPFVEQATRRNTVSPSRNRNLPRKSRVGIACRALGRHFLICVDASPA